MSYVVYHKASTVIIKEFALESSAKRSATCMNRNAGDVYYTYADRETYERRVVYRKTVKNLISGQDVEIDSNTPRCCDPSTEAYWSA
jgi:hypothetical protein